MMLFWIVMVMRMTVTPLGDPIELIKEFEDSLAHFLGSYQVKQVLQCEARKMQSADILVCAQIWFHIADTEVAKINQF